MITKVECSILECDNCKEPFENGSGYGIFADESSMIEDADSSGWETDYEGKHYCENCHHYNDEDEFVLNTSRTKSE